MIRRSLLAALVAVALVLPALPAIAVNEYLCEGLPSAGFVDVDPASPYAVHINCLVAYGISSGTSETTYSPTASVERWQMAIFLENLWFALVLPPFSGSPQGFTDIGGLSTSAQLAVNQSAQLGITTGVAPGLYDPLGAVPRWQMAIFLARFLTAAGSSVNAPAPHGFSDVAALSTEAQNAIAIVKAVGITTGTTATTFSPHQLVSREQMASFLVRTMQTLWFISTTDFVDTCTVDSQGVEICTGAGDLPQGFDLHFVHLWADELPADTSWLDSDGTRIDFFVDGVLFPASEMNVVLPGARLQYWSVFITGGFTGGRVFETRWYIEGDLVAVETVTIGFN